MNQEVKVTTLNANENAAIAAGVELQDENIMKEEKLESAKAANDAASIELFKKIAMLDESDCGCPPDENDANVKPVKGGKSMKERTIVKGIIDGQIKEFIVARTEYGMRHDKKMDKMLNTVDKGKLLTPRFHFNKPDIFWKEGYHLFDNNGELIEEGTPSVFVICDTPETTELVFICDILEHVEIHDFESVEEYAQHIGMTITVSRMPSKVEEMGIAALATEDEAMKTVYEFAIDNHIPYTTSLGFFDTEMKPIVLKTMMRGITPKAVFALGRSKEEAQQLFDAASATFDTDSKKRYVPRALNSLLKKHNQSLEVVIDALNTIPASEVTMAKLAQCGEKESCIVGRMLMWILENNRQKETKTAA